MKTFPSTLIGFLYGVCTVIIGEAINVYMHPFGHFFLSYKEIGIFLLSLLSQLVLPILNPIGYFLSLFLDIELNIFINGLTFAYIFRKAFLSNHYKFLYIKIFWALSILATIHALTLLLSPNT